jgi:hypothetical protein
MMHIIMILHITYTKFQITLNFLASFKKYKIYLSMLLVKPYFVQILGFFVKRNEKTENRSKQISAF